MEVSENEDIQPIFQILFSTLYKNQKLKETYPPVTLIAKEIRSSGQLSGKRLPCTNIWLGLSCNVSQLTASALCLRKQNPA